MSNILARLAELNALRIDLAMSPLKGWKESAAKLEAAIEKLSNKKSEIVATGPSIIEQQIAEAKAANERIARVEASAKNKPVVIKPIAKAEIAALEDHNKAQMKKAGLKKHPIVESLDKAMKNAKPASKVKAVVAKAKERVAEAKAANAVVNVSKIAAELKINAKVARATLRRKKIDRTDEAAVRAALKK